MPPMPGYPAELGPKACCGTPDSGDALAFAGLAPVWEALVRPWLPGRPEAPRRILHDCCAQFIASRAAITALPRAAYRRLLDYVTGARRWPGDERWQYDVQVDFGMGDGPNDWDDSESD